MGHISSLAVAVASALILTGCASSGTGPSGGPPAFPHTRTVDVVIDYHGTRVAAPYRWLDDLDAPEVQRWVEAQNAFTDRWVGNDACARPVLLRVHQGGAHGRNRTPQERTEGEAEILAFMARQLAVHP